MLSYAETYKARMKSRGITLRCKRCKNVWVYRGLSPYYATCSRCKSSINLIRYAVEEEEKK